MIVFAGVRFDEMESKLTKVLSLLTLVGAWAYALGWIKTSYYFRAFGIGLESVEFSVQDYLFASWYAVENVMFFVLLLWVAAIAERLWVYCVVLLYLPLPYLTDLSYSHLDSHALGWLFRLLVGVPHSILKFVPFLILFILVRADKNTLMRFKNSSWSHGTFALVGIATVVIAWSVSAAKHFGTSDANYILRDPAKSLLQVRLHVPENAAALRPIEARRSLYLLYFSQHRCILLDTTNFVFREPNGHVNVLYVPSEKIETVDGVRSVQLDPGHLFW